MPTRRDFLRQSAIACSMPALFDAPQSQAAAAKPLRVLILGGTGFIGPHFVCAALDRGHRVSIFNRGKSHSDLPSAVERLVGDRDGNLESIKHRDWDAVLDLAAYSPRWIRTLGQAIAGRTRHYTFISTESVYRFPGAKDEKSPVQEYVGSDDAYSASTKLEYGPGKVLCEREGEKQFPGKTLVLRPGAIVGPGDPTGALTYWVVRLQRGGEVLVGGEPLAQVEFIDVRDLADWAVRMAEGGEAGIFNTIGPAMPMSLSEMLGAIRGLCATPMKLTWAPVSWLTGQQVKAWSNLLFWPLEAGMTGLMSMSNQRACAKGLTFRPLSVTAADTLAWYRTQSVERQKEALMGFDGNSGIEASMNHERELLTLWHATQKAIA